MNPILATGFEDTWSDVMDRLGTGEYDIITGAFSPGSGGFFAWFTPALATGAAIFAVCVLWKIFRGYSR